MTLADSRNPHRYAQIAAARAIVVHVGAPPAIVEAGLPGARDEVRAYATRIADKWAAFWDEDVSSWSKANKVANYKEAFDLIDRGLGSESDLDLDDEELKEKKRLVGIYESLSDKRKSFDDYREKISSFSLTGPSPSEAWQTLQTHEDALNESREALEKETGEPLKSKKPAPLEVAGGVKQGVKETIEQTAKTVGSAIPWTPIAIAAGLGLGAVLLLKSK
ncbi:MAG: hypothetical protein RIS45_1639 [Planctomycetota bacterium]|jgi:ElaB/YqjD/DUF883 family membrane-anchored ribosome-binding protein